MNESAVKVSSSASFRYTAGMEHQLLNTIVASIVTAFIFGLIAKKLKLPAIFGYLLAGVAIGPHTPGYVGDVELAKQLAEIGIILLMFGVGLHFSIRDLLAVRKVALPGAIFQMISAILISAVMANFLGYSLTQGLIFGLSLSVASTIVLLRSLEQRRLMDTQGGKIAIGWLVIEDVAMVLALVMLPALADMLDAGKPLNVTELLMTGVLVVIKIGIFFAFMMVIGRRFLPWLLVMIAKMRSSELNTLGTLAIALGFAALAYWVFGASLALGAFLAGMVLNESEIGHKSAESSLPMRDAFSVLFFVSVGMLFDPMTLVTHPIPVAITFLIIVFAKSAAAMLIMMVLKQPADAGRTVAFGLAQIGEFSFILGSLALTRGLIPQEMYNLILAGAMLSIVVNPFLFRIYDSRKIKRA